MTECVVNVDLIKEMCWANKISVAELERKTALSNGAIHTWERVSPRVKSIKKVADFFGCTIETLLAPPKGVS